MENTSMYYIGTELKLAITITCEGFNMNTDPWKVTVVGDAGKIVCTNEINSVSDDEDQWYILVDTSKLGKGIIYAIVEIDVPDTDFEIIGEHPATRHEVYKEKLFTIKGV